MRAGEKRILWALGWFIAEQLYAMGHYMRTTVEISDVTAWVMLAIWITPLFFFGDDD